MWADAEILAALRADADRKGFPPKQEEWRTSAPWHPCARVVWQRFGSWPLALEAGGLPRRGISGGYQTKPWTYDTIVFSMVLWFCARGRWPRSLPDWRRCGLTHPASTTVHQVCGSWSGPLADAKLALAFLMAGGMASAVAPATDQ